MPSFLELMALPPFVDNQNLLAFFEVMKEKKKEEVHLSTNRAQEKVVEELTPTSILELADLIGKRLEDRLNLHGARQPDKLVSASVPTCSQLCLPGPPAASGADCSDSSMQPTHAISLEVEGS